MFQNATSSGTPVAVVTSPITLNTQSMLPSELIVVNDVFELSHRLLVFMPCVPYA